MIFPMMVQSVRGLRAGACFSHYYTEPFEFWNQDVVVIGGKNSAAETALDLYRNGVRVTLVHRHAELGSSIKYWVRPDIENRIKAGQVKALFETRVKEITRDEVVVQNGSGEKRLPARQVFALTGYHPDYEFIESLGVKLDPDTRKNPRLIRTLWKATYREST